VLRVVGKIVKLLIGEMLRVENRPFRTARIDLLGPRTKFERRVYTMILRFEICPKSRGERKGRRGTLRGEGDPRFSGNGGKGGNGGNPPSMGSGSSKPCRFVSAIWKADRGNANAEGEDPIIRADPEENHHEDPRGRTLPWALKNSRV
jgi:hypothetical protein